MMMINGWKVKNIRDSLPQKLRQSTRPFRDIRSMQGSEDVLTLVDKGASQEVKRNMTTMI